MPAAVASHDRSITDRSTPHGTMRYRGSRGTRRWAAVALTGVLLSACGQSQPSDSADTATAESTGTTLPAECTSPPPADVTTADGWLGYLAENPDSTSFRIDSGESDETARVEHDADVDRPLASAVKVVHLGAYARAVADGTLDPNENVPVADWEAWYLPGTDGGAHDAALARLGVDPAGSATLDQMVSAMIINSDNAVPDYLRNRLGDEALVEAAAAGGWDDFEPPTLLGSMIEAIVPDVVAGGPWETAQRYASDPAFAVSTREVVTAGVAEAPIDQLALVGGSGTAEQLSNLHRAIADGSFGEGSEQARTHLEYQPAQLPGAEGIGSKGGSLPGVLTDAIYVRYEDGRVATAVLQADEMSIDAYTTALPTFAWQNLMIEAIINPERRAELSCLG